MKLEGYTHELLLDLERAWSACMPNMVDRQRTTDYLAWLLSQTDSQWYQIGDHRAWLYVMNIAPGVSADMHALNLDGWDAVDVPAVRQEILEIMREYNLHRLNVVIPAPVGKLHKALNMLGFTKEGRMRGQLIFNGRHTDAVIYGLMRSEVEHDEIKDVAPPPRKRRRRTRRSRRKGAKKWEKETRPEPQGLPLEASSDKPTSKLPALVN